MNWRDVWLRLRAALFPGRVERELEEEVAAHLELQARKLRQSGMSEQEARRQAQLRFGRAGAVKEACRDERRVGFLENARQDIHYAARGIRHSPGFALAVIATIGLGLGINTAAFTMFNAYVLRPLAVADPYSLYELNWLNRSGRPFGFTWAQYQQLRTDNPVLSEVAAMRGFQLRVDGRQCFGEMVTDNYFGMLGVGAALGRMALPEREPLAVLSYAAWQRLYGGDPGIIGRKILVHGYPVEVSGVARDGFAGIRETPLDLWLPLSLYAQVLDGPSPFDPASDERLKVVGRLRPGITERRARGLLDTLAPRLDPERKASIGLQSNATPVRLSREALLLLIPILAAFAMVLLMACANVANMMLARAVARQREIGIRLSLGAARARIIRQLLTESLVLALPGAAVGFAISQAATTMGQRIILAALPAELAEFVRVAPLDADFRVFAFMLAAAVVSGLAFGMAPAVQATRDDFGRRFRPQRLRNALVLVQIAGCSALLISTGILLRSANRVAQLDTGLRTRDTLAVELRQKFRGPVLDRLANEPLVSGLAVSTVLPGDSGFPSALVVTADRQLAVTSYDYVSPGLFDVLGISILRGRNFTQEEALGGAPVAIVSDTFARREWPGRDAVGQAIRLTPDSRSHLALATPLRFEQATVVGIARDINTGLVDDQTSRTLVYFPTHMRAAGTVVLLRVNGDPESARQRIDRELSDAAPGAVDRIHRLQALVAGKLFPFRMFYWIAAVLGAVALLLAVSGIYGVLSYLVTQRVQEIGIRIALGASPRSVVGLVLGQGVWLAGIGLCVGALLATGAWKMMASLIVVLARFDVVPFLAGAAIVLCGCAAATILPSLRASRLDPMSALRHD